MAWKKLTKILILFNLLFFYGCSEDVSLIRIPLQIDTFKQRPRPVVDILWVIDNSGSMIEERLQLGQKFDKFMNRLLESGADFQIGVISTDADEPTQAGRLQGTNKIITNLTANPQEAFALNIDIVATTNIWEKGLDAMRKALSEEMTDTDKPNQGFLREEASLFVIILSDEDDSSRGLPAYYARWLSHLKGKGEENLVSLSAIAGPKPAGCADAIVGERYFQVQEATGGYAHSICSDDYGPVVDELGMNAAGLRRKFYLSGNPFEDSLVVIVYLENSTQCQKTDDCGGELICTTRRRCGQIIDSTQDSQEVWIYQEGDQTIFFPGSYLPPANSEVDVSYLRRET